jgi:hypothetical protein
MTIKTTISKVGFNLKKHSPAIFTGAGIVGLGATAYLAYKSRDKVEAVVEEIERKNDLDIPINKMEVAKDIAEAIYQPVVVGVASVTCILLAQKIQNNRIKTLVGALAVEQARNVYFEKKYRKQHGDEEYERFVTPTEEEEYVEIDKKGKEKVTVKEVKSDIDKTIGQWFSESDEYVSDDHSYNVAFIDSVNDRLQTIMFQRGTLLLNEVREALGFDRIKAGALLGWTTADSFEIMKSIANIGREEDGEELEQIYVSWSKPRYIYDDVNFSGRYSIL